MRPPDIKALVMEYLRGIVKVPVVSTRPDNGTPAFVRVIATGGAGRSNRVLQQVQLTIDCYETSTGRAATLATTVDEAIHQLPISPLPVNSVTGGTPQDYPDPDVKSPRYTATYQLVTKLT